MGFCSGLSDCKVLYHYSTQFSARNFMVGSKNVWIPIFRGFVGGFRGIFRGNLYIQAKSIGMIVVFQSKMAFSKRGWQIVKVLSRS